MGFVTNYTFLVHNIKFHLKVFFQTPQGKSFSKPIDDWDKTYGYGHK